MPTWTSLRDRFGPSAAMVIGLGVTGVTGYVFLAVIGHALPAPEAAAVTMVFLLVNTVGPGVFTGLEYETIRAGSSALAAGRARAPVIRQALRVGVGLFGGMAVVLLLLGPTLVSRLLGGQWFLLVATLLSMVTALSAHLVRAVLASAQFFTGYGFSLVAEGLGRLLPCVVVALSGLSYAWLYALVYALGQGFGALVGLRLVRTRAGHRAATARRETQLATDLPATDLPGADLPGAETLKEPGVLARRVLLLVVASLLTQLVQNLVPLVVKAKLVGDEALGLAFAQAFVLVRSPLLLFVPVQAMLLPALTAALVRGDMAFVRSRLRLVVGAILVMGLAGTVFFTVAGPWVLPWFGSEVSLARSTLGLLAAGSVLMLMINCLQPALIAFNRHGYSTAGWLAGTAVMCLLLALPVQPITGALLASTVGPAVVLTTMIVGLVGGLRSRRSAPPVPVAATV